MTDVHTGVPSIVPSRRTEDEEIERLLEEFIDEETRPTEIDETNNNSGQRRNDPIRWPTQDANPINEYTTEGYVTMAFPTLFPFGKADLRDLSQREVEIGIADYFNALIRYKDGRFGSHPRYLLHPSKTLTPSDFLFLC